MKETLLTDSNKACLLTFRVTLECGLFICTCRSSRWKMFTLSESSWTLLCSYGGSEWTWPLRCSSPYRWAPQEAECRHPPPGWAAYGQGQGQGMKIWFWGTPGRCKGTRKWFSGRTHSLRIALVTRSSTHSSVSSPSQGCNTQRVNLHLPPPEPWRAGAGQSSCAWAGGAMACWCSWQHYTDKLQSKCSLLRWTRCVQHYSSRSHLGQWCQIHHCWLAGFGMRCKHGSSPKNAGWAAGTPGRSAGWTSPTSQMRHRYSLFPEDRPHEWTGCSCAHLSRTCTAQDPLYDKHSISTAQYALYDTKNRMIKHLRSMKARGNIENVMIVQDFGFFSTCPTIVQCSRNRGGEVRSCLETPDFPWLAPNK